MKKQNFLFLAIAILIMGFVSCNKSGVKNVSLKTQEDSLNYYVGYLNGSGIKDQFFQVDSSEEAINKFVEKLENAYKSKDEMEKMGIQFGEYLKQMQKSGLMGDSTIKLDINLVKQGLLNGLKDYKEGMTAEQANQYFNETMQKMQQSKVQAPPHPSQHPETQQGENKK